MILRLPNQKSNGVMVDRVIESATDWGGKGRETVS
jgi:hypothetical protein